MKKSKGFIGEFKEFISRGNVVDMAVGIIVGSAFTAIVTSLVNDIITPIIGYLIGGLNFSDFKFEFPAIVEGLTPATITYGNFIQTVINFLITTFAVFCMVKVLNSLRRKKEEPAPEEPAAPAEPEIPADIQLLTEIRDYLKENAQK